MELSPLFYARLERVLGPRAVEEADGSTSLPPCLAKLNPVRPRAQKGPQCGLVALSMASELLAASPLDVQEIFSAAQAAGWTLNGEMFSAAWLAHTARQLLGPAAHVQEAAFPTAQDLVRWLASHPTASLLVPYDTDKDHAPCEKAGHSAHWAVLLGFVLLQPSTALTEDSTPDPHFPCLRWLDSSSQASLGDVRSEDLHVLAYHGKSAHLALWSYDELRRSSEGLRELGPKREGDGLTYRLPDQPISQTLADRVLFLRSLP